MKASLPLSQLAAFEAAARFRSFTAAARDLNVQQPAISRRIAALEAQLETPLFLRTKPHLTLTPSGEALFRVVTSGFGSIRKEVRRIEAMKSAAPVVVNASIGFTSLYLMPRLAEFQARFPDYPVQIVTRDQNLDFDEAVTDVVITFGEEETSSAEGTVIVGEALVPVCAPGFLPDDAPIAVNELPTQKLLHMSAPEHLGDWARYFEGSGLSAPEPVPTERIMSYMVYLLAIQNGQGIGLGWRGLIEPMLKNSSLVIACKRTVETDRAYSANLTSRSYGDPGARAFRHWITNTLSPLRS